MSEHEHQFGDFFRKNRLNLLIGAVSLGAGFSGFAAARISANHRKNKPEDYLKGSEAGQAHELPLTERQKIFAFETDSADEPTLTTRLAAFIYMQRLQHADRAASLEVIDVYFAENTGDDVQIGRIREALDVLRDNHFIEKVPMGAYPDREAYEPTADLIQVENDATCMPLLQAIAEQSSGV